MLYINGSDQGNSGFKIINGVIQNDFAATINGVGGGRYINGVQQNQQTDGESVTFDGDTVTFDGDSDVIW